MLKEFKVYASMSTRLQTTIEAVSLEEAEAMAEVMDGAEFIEIEGASSWSIDEVVELPPSITNKTEDELFELALTASYAHRNEAIMEIKRRLDEARKSLEDTGAFANTCLRKFK